MTIRRSLKRFPLVPALAILALGHAAPARAQLAQVCLSLNESAPGIEYVSVPSKTGLEGHAAYTIEAWIRPTSYAGFPTIVGNDYASSYWLGLTTTGKLRFYPRGGVLQYVDTGNSVPLDQWTHVAAVYNSATGYTIYINGQVETTGNTITGAVGTSAGDLRIGADRELGSPSYFWRGYLDEIRIWNVARTGPQIREYMEVSPGRPSAFTNGLYDALEAHWAVEATAIAFMFDSGLSPANTADFVNGDFSTHTTLSDPFGPPVAPNVALQLNGADDRVVLPVSEGFARGVTVMAWVAPTNPAAFPTIAGRDFTQSFWFGVTPGGTIRFYPRGGTPVDGSTPIPTVGRWTHVAASYDGERTVLYINGEVDRISTAISGPVGANGRDVWIGADNGAYGLGYPFAGWIDNVKVVQGALSAERIRVEMYQGWAGISSPFDVADQEGVPVPMYHVEFDRREAFAVLGSSAKLVRGGTPTVAPYTMHIASRSIDEFLMYVSGGHNLPNGATASNVQGFLDWPLAQVIAEVEVFVAAPSTSLADTHILLTSPIAATVDLLSRGEATGHDVLTVVYDAAPETWATGSAPYHSGVRPSQPLSTLVGQPAQGQWRLNMLTSAPALTDIWAWGLRINGVALDAGTPPVAGPVALQLSGANPVRGTGTLAFDLPRAAQVDLALYDIGGRRVRAILTGDRAAGSYRMSFATAGLDAGVYFARLLVDGAESRQVKVIVLH